MDKLGGHPATDEEDSQVFISFLQRFYAAEIDEAKRKTGDGRVT